jgi:hypothetical protein
MIDVSIIIVNWNTKALLLDLIESIYQTTKVSLFEIIVVDNDSTDGSIDAVHNSFPRVLTIINSSNLGFAKANNIGIRRAKGRYVCLINSDVKVLDKALDNMVAYMDAHLEIGALAPKTFWNDMNIQQNCREFPNLRNAACQSFYLHRLFPKIRAFRDRTIICDHSTILPVEALSGCFMMVRQEVIARVGVLDERFFFYSEDVDWSKRIYDDGWKLVYYPRAEVIHYGGASSDNASLQYEIQLLKANWQYWKKHKNVFECSLFWLIKFLGSLMRMGGWLLISLFISNDQSRAKISAKVYGQMLVWLLVPKLGKG